MLSEIYFLFSQTRGTIRDDLQTDPKLRYILFLSFILAGFWFWWRIPNFATPDEYGRLLRPMKAAGYFLADPSFEALRRGATEGGASDATFYFHGLLLVPVFIIVLATGNLDTFAGLTGIESRFILWQTVPEWYWTSVLVIARLANVFLVVGIVYVTYRIATTLADRRAGRLSAVFTTLSLAVIHTGHEANEDTPMVFLLLVTLYLSLRYLQNKEERYFVLGCAIGGLAMAFKMTGGVVIFFLGTAFVLRDIDGTRSLSRSLQTVWRPKPLLMGAFAGLLLIYLGKPNFLFSGPDWFIENYVTRFIRKSAEETRNPPLGYIATLRYLNGLGLPLTLGAVGGTIAGVKRCLSAGLDRKGELVLLVGIAVYFFIFILVWESFRTHHLLPSIPLLMIPLGITLAVHLNDGNRIARVVVAVLLATTALYAGFGVYEFTNNPRDEATRWLASETNPDETMTVYENSVADLGVVHGQSLDRYDFVEKPGVSQSIANDTDYTEWMLSTTQREPDYIQVIGESSLHDPVEYPERAAYKQRLLTGDVPGYTVAAEFGETPPDRSRLEQLVRTSIVPEPEKRRDHVVILTQNDTAR